MNKGVDRFIIYDDGSTDNTSAVLAPHIAAGYVVFRKVSEVGTHIPKGYKLEKAVSSRFENCHNDQRTGIHAQKPCQVAVIAECSIDVAYNVKGVNGWVGMLDVDEFLFIRPDVAAASWHAGELYPVNFAQYLESLPPHVGGIKIHGLTFGYLGVLHENWTGSMLETHLKRGTFYFHYAASMGPNSHSHIKCFVRHESISPSRATQHLGRPLHGVQVEVRPDEPPGVRLHHYRFPSAAESLAKAIANNNEAFSWHVKHMADAYNFSDSCAVPLARAVHACTLAPAVCGPRLLQGVCVPRLRECEVPTEQVVDFVALTQHKTAQRGWG
eukprot:TRINITY_DN1081_c1_g1_i2.p1 TRINITY_DN1081_c1_g1~~TRINITY_DN1081_c1_g1_i2.p1  ORF type:complete len:327 (-),score=70.05 TRINITY_DN1081_c1_g1_i2:54-1034(-)